MGPVDIEFKPLLTNSRPRDSEALAQETRDGLLQGRRPSAYRSIVFWIIITVHGIITVTLALALYNDRKHYRRVSCPQDSLLYCEAVPRYTAASLMFESVAPAREAVVYETRPFVLGHVDGPAKTLFGAEPSEEVDKAWTDLYNGKCIAFMSFRWQEIEYSGVFAISQIPNTQARLLPNKTLPIPGDTGNYIISLSVFHQLHCLNVMRKALRADYYADPVTGNIGNIVKNELPGHLDHCVDMLRQALMCSADISPLVWQWSEKARIAKPASDVVHTCRNYDNIVDWAKANQIKHHFDTTTRVEDDIIML